MTRQTAPPSAGLTSQILRFIRRAILGNGTKVFAVEKGHKTAVSSNTKNRENYCQFLCKTSIFTPTFPPDIELASDDHPFFVHFASQPWKKLLCVTQTKDVVQNKNVFPFTSNSVLQIFSINSSQLYAPNHPPSKHYQTQVCNFHLQLCLPTGSKSEDRIISEDSRPSVLLLGKLSTKSGRILLSNPTTFVTWERIPY